VTRPRRPEATAALDALASVLVPHGAAFASGPLEHGLLFYEARACGTPAETVRQRNQTRLTQFARSVRSRIALPVIDPGLLHVGGWDPAAYDDFFLEVIRRFVCQAWFVDAWEYSHGATKEYVLCTQLGLEVLDERGATLTPRTAVALLSAAIELVAGFELDPARLRSRLEVLQALTSRGR
jgi:hypothetical protein